MSTYGRVNGYWDGYQRHIFTTIHIFSQVVKKYFLNFPPYSMIKEESRNMFDNVRDF